MAEKPWTVRTVAQWVGGEVEGDESLVLGKLAAIDEAEPGDLTFADARHAGALSASRAGAAIVGRDAPRTAPMVLIRVEDVHAAIYKLLCKLAGPEDLPQPGVDPTAVVSPEARIAPDAGIGPHAVVGAGAEIGRRTVLCAGAFIGRGVTVGADCVLAEGVVVRSGCRLGSRVRVGSNSVIGYDGFGYHTAGGVHRRVPHVGNVVIEDDVEIGACSCVDRAKFGSTVIGAGSKIDNLVQVAHNCRLGAGCILAGQVGLAGSANLGSYVVLGGQAGVADNVTVGEGAQLGARATALQDLAGGQAYTGCPASPLRETLRVWKSLERLPDLLKRVRELESRLDALVSSKDH